MLNVPAPTLATMSAFEVAPQLPAAVDMRSDTVTRPSVAMREAMSVAEVGDDLMRDDPTVRALEERVATLFGKESALFFPSGTMSNLTALLCWCQLRGSEYICGDKSHVFLFEQAGGAQFGGCSPRTVPNLADGTFDLDLARAAIREDDVHEPITRLICVENTHNFCGGCVLPLQFQRDLRALATEHGLPIHLDGARLWNAITESGQQCSPSQLASLVDSMSVCLSKGLGAPAGSLLVGPADLISKARRVRKALGGGMRQIGVLAAAGLCALDDFEGGMLALDHARARLLADALRPMPSFTLRPSKIDSNIVFADIVTTRGGAAGTGATAEEVQAMLRERGVLVSAWAARRIRLVLHRDVDDSRLAQAIAVLTEVDGVLSG